MRNFHMFNPAIWKDQEFRKSLNDREKLAYLFLSTSHHQNMLGSYYIPDSYAVNDLGWSIDEYTSVREKLQACGFIIYDEDTEEVFITDWFRSNPPCNAKHYLGMMNCLRKVGSVNIHDAIVKNLHKVIEGKGDPAWFGELRDKGLTAEPREEEF